MAKRKNTQRNTRAELVKGVDIMTDLPLRFTAAASIITGVAAKPDSISRKTYAIELMTAFELAISV